MKGTRTEQNLLKAFAGESQARNRYLYFAKIARKEGYQQIAGIFEQTADHELSHAKSFFKFLNSDEPVEITACYPGGRLGTTVENLKSAIRGEHEEWTDLYIQFAETAYADDLPKVEALFKNVAMAEEFHEERFKKILARLESGEWFERHDKTKWMCLKCGYIHEGTEPPNLCPACLHSKAYFEELTENY